MKKIILSTILLAPAITAFAQLSGSVSVEGEYEPLVIQTERLNSFPQRFRFELPLSNLNYEFNGIVTDFRPGLLTMGVTGRQTAWPWKKRRGYVDLSAGSYLNSRLDAGYYILSDSVNTLLADLQFRSSTLFRTDGVSDLYTRMPLKRWYDGHAGLEYTRLMGTEGMLEACLGYGLEYYNYYGTTLPKNIALNVNVPTQTVNRIEGNVSYSSSPSFIKGWHAGVGVDYTGFRRFYAPAAREESVKGERVTQLKAETGYALSLSSTSALAIDATGSFLFFADKSPRISGIKVSDRRDYGIISLKPSYRFANNAFTVKAGVDMALAYDAMGSRPGKNFGVFHIAPDARIDYHSNSGIGLFLHATGGVTPSTLMLKEEFDRYLMPATLSTLPVYSPIDGRVGINLGPFSGFEASVAFRYTVAKNIPTGGWYQYYLGTYLSAPFALDVPAYLDPYSQTVNLHGFSVDADLGYALGTLLNLSVKGSYCHQKGENGIFNGLDRPRWILGAKAEVSPIKQLKIGIGYDYRGVRNCYAWSGNSGEELLTAYRLADITDLNASITYSILSNFDIYCKGNNLLNRRVDILPGLQSEGMVICGGFHLEF